MTLAAVIADAVAGAAALTQSLQVPVSLEQWIGHKDGSAKPDYDEPLVLAAIVQEGSTQVRTSTGETFTARACVSFLELPPINGAAGRREPIDPRDRITLPSGLTAPIVDNVGALLNPDTSLPFVLSVWLR